jgi:serpin B
MKKYLIAVSCLLTFGFIQKDQKATFEDATDSINRFTFDFYKHTLAGKNENSFASPYSVSSAFAMMYAGSDGETKNELSETFYFGKDSNFHEKFASHQNNLQANLPKGLALEVANAVWYKQGRKVLPAYQTLMKEHYRARIEGVDFTNPTKTCKIVNDWTNEKTHEKIQKIIAPEHITPDLHLILTNAIYFKSSWKKSFNKETTEDRNFQATPETTVKVPFMQDRASYKYFDNNMLQMIEMPYTDDASSMVVVLPRNNVSLETLEQELSYKNYQDWEKNMRNRMVNLYLPKFKVEQSFLLNENLKKMGVKQSFSDNAEYPYIIDKTNLKISAVLHKSFVEVNEEGTEAAAVTAILAVPTSTSVNRQPENIIFMADRPFIFFIKDNKTNTILFVGKIMNPAKN